MVHEDLPVLAFTAEDRCDGCGARALALANHEELGDLLFCGHHIRESEDNLLDEGWAITYDYEALEQLAPQYTYPAPV